MPQTSKLIRLGKKRKNQNVETGFGSRVKALCFSVVHLFFFFKCKPDCPRTFLKECKKSGILPLLCLFPVISKGHESIFLNEERRGLNPSTPGRSCKDIVLSGIPVRSGEYWIDPENSGNPFKVFCDMSTNGGKCM